MLENQQEILSTLTVVKESVTTFDASLSTTAKEIVKNVNENMAIQQEDFETRLDDAFDGLAGKIDQLGSESTNRDEVMQNTR